MDISFTEEEYNRFLNSKSHIANRVYRNKGESYFSAMMSDEADFTKTKEGKDALKAIIAFGKGEGNG